MSLRYKGAVISATPPTTTGGESGTATGVWTLEQQMQAQGTGNWPSPLLPKYIEDVFSTYLYVGNSSTQTITNNIDLSGKGGLVWGKARGGAEGGYNHFLQDTVRGAGQSLTTNNTDGNISVSTYITAFNSTGFAIGSNGTVNNSGSTFASWTFREQPKFFDIVTYTGNGSNRTISHNLGSTPGCIIVKSTSNSEWWAVYHRSLGATKTLYLNSTNAQETNATNWNNTEPTSAVFTVGTNTPTNANGQTYVAYLFAHDAGGFGTSGSDNVITCGSFTTDGSGNATVSLGYEPQWILAKGTNAARDWWIFDNMREMSFSNTLALRPNLSNAEYSFGSGIIRPTATGFNAVSFDSSGVTWAYIAIRRGPMKTPTVGTSVFYPQAIPQADFIDSSNVPFPPDLVNTFSRNGINRTITYQRFQFADRLRSLGNPNNTLIGSGCPSLTSTSTNAEATTNTYIQLKADSRNITRSNGWNSDTYGNWIYYFWQRAPGFFDVVCYTGNGSTQNVNHSLGVAPELIIVKSRSLSDSDWWVYAAPLTTPQNKYLRLQSTDGEFSITGLWGSSLPTSTTFGLGAFAPNSNAATFVAYLFATVAGVSKVGSYTGTGTTLQVNCGFTNGSRFVLIKRTDSTGDWYVWDSARGIVAGNDPYLLLNNTNAEVTNTDYVDTFSSGFEISSTAPAAINANGGTFIFLAIA